MMISVSRSCFWTQPSPLSASCPLRPPLYSWLLRTAPRPLEQERRRAQSRSPEPRHHQLPRSSPQLSVPVINIWSQLPLNAVFTCFATFFFTGESERSRSPSDMMSHNSDVTGNVTRSCDVGELYQCYGRYGDRSLPWPGSQPPVRCYLYQLSTCQAVSCTPDER